MSRIFLALLLATAWLDARAQSSLPPCPGDFKTTTWTNCFGTYTYYDGSKYVGEYRDGKRNGQGIEYAANGTISRSGLWANGALSQAYAIDTSRFPSQSSLPPCPTNKKAIWTNCAGRFDWWDGEHYIGEFRDNKRNGFGTNQYVGGRAYRGMWVNDKQQGKGTEFMPDGSVYVGEFFNNKRAGQGVLTIPSGEKYEGQFLSGVRHGQGKKMFPDGSIYNGEWRDDSPTGRGTFTSPIDIRPKNSPEIEISSSSNIAVERKPSDSSQREMPNSSKTAVEVVNACLERGLKPGSALFSKCIAGG